MIILPHPPRVTFLSLAESMHSIAKKLKQELEPTYKQEEGRLNNIKIEYFQAALFNKENEAETCQYTPIYQYGSTHKILLKQE